MMSASAATPAAAAAGTARGIRLPVEEEVHEVHEDGGDGLEEDPSDDEEDDGAGGTHAAELVAPPTPAAAAAEEVADEPAEPAARVVLGQDVVLAPERAHEGALRRVLLLTPDHDAIAALGLALHVRATAGNGARGRGGRADRAARARRPRGGRPHRDDTSDGEHLVSFLVSCSCASPNGRARVRRLYAEPRLKRWSSACARGRVLSLARRVGRCGEAASAGWRLWGKKAMSAACGPRSRDTKSYPHSAIDQRESPR